MKPLVLFHGTSDTLLDAILKDGLMVVPASQRVSAGAEGAWAHLLSFDGVYAATNPESAECYALKAASLYGGAPMIVSLVADPLDTHPDEDDLTEFFANYGTDFSRLFPVPDFAASWTTDSDFRDRVISKVAADLVSCFSPVVQDGTFDAVAQILHAAFARLTAEDFKAMSEHRGHVLAPSMFEPLLENGGVLYRQLIDAVARSLRGTGAYDGWESHKLRLPAGAGFEGITRIIGIGTLEDAFAHYRGNVTPDLDEMIELEFGVPAPTP